MVDAGAVDDAAVVGIAADGLSRLQVMDRYYLAAGYHLSAHPSNLNITI